MKEKRGLFIVFEGIDGCGKGTQLDELFRHIKERDKYQDIIATHEPWKRKEIKEKLSRDRDAYSDGVDMARLYVEDRIAHSLEIDERLDSGYFVLCDRYKMSTCAYQWTQGVDLFKLFKLHDTSEILTPDLTVFIDLSAELAQERRMRRGGIAEKFEDFKFQKNLMSYYHNLVNRPDAKSLFGRIESVNGRGEISEVFERVKNVFEPVYSNWRDNQKS